MMRCKSCAAPLDGLVCRYCGARNNIDLEHVRSFTNIRPMQIRICPICHIQMSTIDVGKKVPFLIERCDSCYGLFFDNDELDVMIENSVKGSRNVDLDRLSELTENPRHVDIIVYRRCPVCKKMMDRKNYRRRSGVILDVCAEHGVWLDPGELRQIMEWVKSGGAHWTDAQEIRRSRYIRASRVTAPESLEDKLKEGGVDLFTLLAGLFR